MAKRLHPKKSNKTIFHIFIICFVCACIVFSNILYIMVTKTHLRSGVSVMDYAFGAETETIIKASRGEIKDRNGEVLAQDVDSYTMIAYLNPKRTGINNTPAYVTDTKDASEKLAPILNVKAEDIQVYFDTAQAQDAYLTYFGTIGKNITSAQKEAIEALEITGLEFTESQSRYYPIGKFASHLIGFAKYDEEQGKLVGQIGAEAFLNSYLSGEDGLERYQATANQTALPGTRHVIQEAKDGYDVYLTLDKAVQTSIENLLQKTMDEFDAQRAWAIMMEVETGKILGWSAYPTFDLNKQNVEDWRNIPSMYNYEPGSVMKAITYAAAIDSGTYPDSSQTYESGTFNIGIDDNGEAYRSNTYNEAFGKIQDAEGKNHGVLTYDDGFKLSSNIAICELLTKYMDPAIFEEYLDRFGFFQRVGMDFIEEEVGAKNFTYPIEKLTTGFGQGSSVTAIQMMQAFSALVNDGKMMKPYYVDRIVDSETGEVIEQFSPESSGTPISKETADKVKDLMYKVINEQGGTGYARYRMDDVEVIGKTGTGQVFTNGSYTNAIYINSVMAAAPYDDPKVLLYWAFESSDYRNFTGDAFREAFRTGLIATGVAGDSGSADSNTTWKETAMPQLENHTLDYAKQKLEGSDTSLIVIGNGNGIIQQYPNAEEKVVSKEHVFVLTDGEDITIPDMTGWSRKDVMTFAQLANMPVIFDGFGLVKEQSLKAGTKWNKKDELTVKLNGS